MLEKLPHRAACKCRIIIIRFNTINGVESIRAFQLYALLTLQIPVEKNKKKIIVGG